MFGNQQQQNTHRYIWLIYIKYNSIGWELRYYLTAIMECKDNNCSVYVHSLYFPLMIYVTKIGQFHVSNFLLETGPIPPFVVLAHYILCKTKDKFEK